MRPGSHRTLTLSTARISPRFLSWKRLDRPRASIINEPSRLSLNRPVSRRYSLLRASAPNITVRANPMLSGVTPPSGRHLTYMDHLSNLGELASTPWVSIPALVRARHPGVFTAHPSKRTLCELTSSLVEARRLLLQSSTLVYSRLRPASRAYTMGLHLVRVCPRSLA